jgi:hypothetical protein
MLRMAILLVQLALALGTAAWLAVIGEIAGTWIMFLALALVVLNVIGLLRMRAPPQRSWWWSIGWWSCIGGGTCLIAVASVSIWWWPVVWRDDSLFGMLEGIGRLMLIAEMLLGAAAGFLLFGWSTFWLSHRFRRR